MVLCSYGPCGYHLPTASSSMKAEPRDDGAYVSGVANHRNRDMLTYGP